MPVSYNALKLTIYLIMSLCYSPTLTNSVHYRVYQPAFKITMQNQNLSKAKLAHLETARFQTNYLPRLDRPRAPVTT